MQNCQKNKPGTINQKSFFVLFFCFFRLDLLHLRRRRFPNGWQPGLSHYCYWLCCQPPELLCRQRWLHSWPPELFFHAVSLLKCFGLKSCAVNVQDGPLNCSVLHLCRQTSRRAL